MCACVAYIGNFHFLLFSFFFGNNKNIQTQLHALQHKYFFLLFLFFFILFSYPGFLFYFNVYIYIYEYTVHEIRFQVT